MRLIVLNLIFSIFFIINVNASSNDSELKYINKENLLNSLNLDNFDNFLTSIKPFDDSKNEYFKNPNEKNINKLKSEFIFNNQFSTLDLMLRFKAVANENPEYLFEIYKLALSKTKSLNFMPVSVSGTVFNTDDTKNLIDSNYEMLTVYFVEELMNILGVENQIDTRAEVENENGVTIKCMDGGEDCPPHSPGAEYTKLASLGGASYGLIAHDYGPIYAGTTRQYDADLAATWASRQEFKNVNFARSTDLGSSPFHAMNPYELLGVNKAYGYGLSGSGITVSVMDSDQCTADHIDLAGKTVTIHGSVTTSSSSSTHGCHVTTTVLGTYQNNSDSTNTYYDGGTYDASLAYSNMGVAYNSNLFMSDFNADDTTCSGASDTDCAGPQGWELAIEAATAAGAKVHTNSWGFTSDADAQLIKAYYDANSVTMYEAIANTYGSYGDTNSWEELTDAMDAFQEQGVILWAISNDNSGAMSTVYGGSDNYADFFGSLPSLETRLNEAWISVVNVGLGGGNNTRTLLSAPCSLENAAFCVSHDGHNITAGTRVSGSESYVGIMTGTSMATPQVAGAVALLFEAFPDNTPELITKRLLLTADNSWIDTNVCYLQSEGDYDNYCGGFAGTLTFNGINHKYSEIYGHGNPDVYAALQPIGKKDFMDNQDRAIPIVGSILLSSTVFGNAMSFVDEQVYYRDQLDGGFKINLNSLVGNYQSRDNINKRLFSDDDYIWSGTFNNQGLNFATSYQIDRDQNSLSDDHKFYLSFKSGQQSVFVGQKYSIEQMLGLQNNNSVSSILNRNTGNNSVLSLTEASGNGQVIGSEIDLDKNLSFTVAAYNGEHATTDLNEKGFLANLKHKSNSNNISLFFGQNIESDSILRSSGAGAFGSFSGKTYHAGFNFEKKLSDNIYIAGLFDYGVVKDTSVGGMFLDDISNLETSEFNLGLVMPNVLSKNDYATFKISQPLRTENGTSRLNLPGLRDSSGIISMTTKNINLEPSGRELNFDAGYEKVVSPTSSYKLGTQLSVAPNHTNSNSNEHMVYGLYSIAF